MRRTTIDMIRHGEPEGGRRYRGQIDDPLSELGWCQMREAVAEHCPWDVIVSSTLSRCLRFAEELAERHGLPLESDDRLKELGFGEWEGQTPAELTADDPERLMRFWTDPTANVPPGAETLPQFRERVIGAWNDIIERHRDKHILLVGHAGQMRMVIREILDMPLDRMFRIQVSNAAITRIRVDEEFGRVLPRLLFHGGSLG